MTRLAFNLSTGADTGGAAIREVEAFANPQANLEGEWEVRAMVAGGNYIKYPEDLPYSTNALLATYDRADVVHLNHTLHGHTWYDDHQGKPTILEHHGLHKGSFSVDLEESIVEGINIGAVQIGSTVNLELFGPPGTIEWAPIPYNLAVLRRMRQAFEQRPSLRSRPIRIAHAPTNRAIKSTDAFLAAMQNLQAKHYPIEVVLIEGRTHAECLRLKATADILVDQLQLGYGCNAIEAWGMGIPVVGGVTTASWRDHMVERYDLALSPTGLPFYSATEESLERHLIDLIDDPALRLEWAVIGATHARRWHSQAHSVEQMSRIYDEAGPTMIAVGRSKRQGHAARKVSLQQLRRARESQLEAERGMA